jgi:acyl-CoA thioesterase I
MHRLAVIAIAGSLAISACASHHLDENEILYMAIGASDAVGIAATPLTNGYVYRIEDKLEDEGKKVQLLNLGIPAANLDTIAQAVRGALRIGAKPDLVTIWVGANDIIDGVDPQQFDRELDDLLGRLQDTKAFIAIADIPDLTELPRFRENPIATVTRERISAFNQVIQQRAEKHGAALVRLSDEPVEDRFVSDLDGFHPNDRGHKRIAELFLAVIEPEVASQLSGLMRCFDYGFCIPLSAVSTSINRGKLRSPYPLMAAN